MTEEKRDYQEVPTKEGDEVKAEGEGDVVGLKPKMTLFNGITVIVGSIIGSGIFISPSVVLANTGSVGMSLVVWIISGVFSMVGAYCYAELGCMIQKTGADYAYIMVTFGPLLAFMRLWVECIIVRPCSQTIVALTFSIYIMKPFFPDCDTPDSAERLLAAVCIRESLPGFFGGVPCLPFLLSVHSGLVSLSATPIYQPVINRAFLTNILFFYMIRYHILSHPSRRYSCLAA